MRLHQSDSSPRLRWLAGIAVWVFVAAQSLCFAHCQLGAGRGDGAQPACHGPARTEASQDQPHTPLPTPTSTPTCATLQSMLAGADAPAFVTPPSHTLLMAAEFSLERSAAAAHRDSTLLRPAASRDWVFTPEVFLGPAFRSLAPPAIG